MLLEHALLIIQVFLIVVLIFKENLGSCTERLNLARPHKLIFSGIPVAANTITSSVAGEGENLPEDYTMEDALYNHMRSATAI